jgi:serine/threonine protein kinase
LTALPSGCNAAAVQFGPYTLTERLAVGGMAEVFRAVQRGAEGFERVVAIKRILPDLADDEAFINMFVDEAKISVQLSHPNIAQVFDLGCIDGAYYIAMEFVEGRDLRSIQRRYGDGRALPVDITCHIALKILEALDHAHRAEAPGLGHLGIIHRDVSPHNLLLSFDGEVKVIDFGLARAAGRAVRTRAGVVKGKTPYLSAEQARGQEIDHRSDLFSMGTCLYEWLSGTRLFLRKTETDTILAVRRAEVAPLAGKVSTVPRALAQIVHRALEPSPAHRYQSAREMHDALEAFVFSSGNVVTQAQVADWLADLFPAETQSHQAALHHEEWSDFEDTQVTEMTFWDTEDLSRPVIPGVPGIEKDR